MTLCFSQPHCDSDKEIDQCVMFIRMLYGEVVLASTSLQLSRTFLQNAKIPSSILTLALATVTKINTIISHVLSL